MEEEKSRYLKEQRSMLGQRKVTIEKMILYWKEYARRHELKHTEVEEIVKYENELLLVEGKLRQL
jgi:hypothetical protein